ncbi:MAG: glycosyltransferase [Gemmatimonadota bacterium]
MDPSRPGGTFRWGTGIEGSSIPQLGISQFRWTGHDRRWESDLRALREALGPCWLRYPVAWESAEPARGAFAWDAVAGPLELARDLGFEVVPGLIHFGTPRWLPGAFGDPDLPEAVEAYAAAFAQRFRGLAAAYVPVNEPLITALFAGDLGLWPPFGRGWRGYMPVLSRTLQALARATRALRAEDPGADVVHVEAVEEYRSCEAGLAEDVKLRNARRFAGLDLVMGRVDERHPLRSWLVENGFPEPDLEWFRRNPQPPTHLGLDYYRHSETDLSTRLGGVRQAAAKSPRGFAALAAEYHARYGLPLIATETNACGSEAARLAWLEEMIREVRAARAAGTPLEGLFWWPAFDHVDWDGALLHQSRNVHPVGLWRLAGELGAYEIAPTALVTAFARLTRRGDADVGPVAAVPRARGGTLSLTSGEPPVSSESPPGFPIVVHCHLRWSFVWQRPQQTHCRLARSHPVLFLEEPEWDGTGRPARLQLSEPWPNVTVATPILPAGPRDRGTDTEAAVMGLLRESLDGPLGRRFAGAVHWLYTPQMEPQLDAFADVGAVVYDCMDELSRFAFAPAELVERERRLLARAGVVFTGGHELQRAKSRLHRNVHLFGCGVDYEHFHAAAEGLAVPADLAFVSAPRVGYVGVIDERLDYGLLTALCEDNPDWSLVMVGPVVKVDPAALPRPVNAFYLGARPYEMLPAYLAGFDACLMPFALNEATEFINPTKTLEYLATGKPVVSTPVRDVVRSFSDVVHVAPRERFGRELRRVLAGDRHDPRAGLQTARRASWERVVGGMEELALQALLSASDCSPSPQAEAAAAGGRGIPA